MRPKQKKISKPQKQSNQQKKTQSKQIFSSFKVRPPIIQLPKIKVNDVFECKQEKEEKVIGDSFKVYITNFDIQQFTINIKLFQQTLEQEKIMQREPAQLLSHNDYNYSAQNSNSLVQQQKINGLNGNQKNVQKKFSIKSFENMSNSKAKVEQKQEKQEKQKQIIIIRMNDEINKQEEKKDNQDNLMVQQNKNQENRQQISLISDKQILEEKQKEKQQDIKIKKEDYQMIDEKEAESLPIQKIKPLEIMRTTDIQFQHQQRQKQKQQQKIDSCPYKNDRKLINIFYQETREKIDLGKCNLIELLAHFYKEKLMLSKYYQIFQQGYGTQPDQNKILKIYQKGQDEKEFRNYLFTIIDHRMFAAILIRFNQDKYTSSEIPLYVNPNMSYQMRKIYGFTIQQYLKEWDQFNQRNLRFWMPNSRQFLSNCQFFKYIPRAVQNNSSHPLNILLNLPKIQKNF